MLLKIKYIFIILLIISVSVEAQKNQDTLYLKSIALIQQQKYSEALQIADKLVQTNTSNFDYYKARADVNFLMGKYIQAAEDYLYCNKVKENSVNYQLAQCYGNTSNADEAVYYLQKYFDATTYPASQQKIKLDKAFLNIENSVEWREFWKLDNYSKTELQLADAEYLLSKERFFDALEKVNKIIKHNKKNFKALTLRGDIFYQMKEYKNAVANYSKALNYSKNDMYILEKRADALSQLGKFKKSAEDYEIISKKTPSNFEALKKLSFVKNKANLPDTALYFANCYENYFPENKEIKSIKADIFINQKNYIQALSAINQLLKEEPYNPKFIKIRANCYLQTEAYQYAISDYNLLLDFTPDDAEIYYQRGIAKQKINDMTGACADWKKAREMGFYEANNVLVKYCR